MDTSLEQQFVGNEVPCLIIPVDNGQLVLPTVTVAEMIPYRQPQRHAGQDAPTWFLGRLPWRGLTVPLLSFEAINGLDAPAIQASSQISIFNNTGVNAQLPFLAIPTTGIPHLSRITPESIKATETETRPYETMHVNIDGGVAVIPDISSLERACSEFLGL